MVTGGGLYAWEFAKDGDLTLVENVGEDVEPDLGAAPDDTASTIAASSSATTRTSFSRMP